MKVLVTGATGFVGREIISALHTSGHDIHFLTRNLSSASAHAIERGFDGQVHVGSVLDPRSLPDACKNIDSIIHLVGIISEVGQSTFENVHTEGTRNIINATCAAGVKRFIHMSALGTRPNAVARYHQSKWAAEEIVRRSGLDYTIFRPSIIYGPYDHFVNLFARIARSSPILPVIGSGKSKLQPVPVEDVAACFVKSLAEPKSVGQTFDLCGPDALSFEEILNGILRVIGRKCWKLHLPMPLARFQAAMLELVFGKILRKTPPLNRDQLIMLAEDNVGNPRAANALFGLKPIPFEEGIARYLKR